jgi:LmbE family N-acetylglucosaminyl deacetylase/CTP:molybdopterin cytidylyltransferase MocA
VESDLIPQRASSDIPARAALVLAPHADDEVFGCAGAIAAHVRQGVAVKVVVLTDGAAFADPAVRNAESRAAAAMLGYGEPEFWGIPDRGLAYSEELVARVVETIKAQGADLVYAPSPWEFHPDHRQASKVAVEAAVRTGARVAFYEVGAPLRPNVLLDITATFDLKKRAMQCFASQQAQQDYARHIGALNEYRSYTLPAGHMAAEAYLVLGPAELLRELPAGLREAVSFGFSPSTQPANDVPLVSVLIRSVDRQHLQEALDSVALQTWPNIEVVVIAAQPGHQPLPERCGPFPLRLVPTDVPLPRSKAANRALDEARGEWLLFLDDDDWLTPGHVARLAQVLQLQPHARAAYTGIALVDGDGRPLGQTLDLPFDGIRQLAGNLTPIHAVLFSRDLLAAGLRFDEALDRYEDWDFWLQLSRQTLLVHLPGASAVYRIHESSGVHNDTGPGGEATQLVYRKWKAGWDAGQGHAMMQKVWAAHDLEAQLARLQLELAEVSAARSAASTDLARALDQRAADMGRLHAEIESQLRKVAVREAEMAAFLNSTSWKLTAPLRALSRIFKGN